ncbi:MAG: molybdopterin-dependent oxidoreductase, partial [Methylococcales bacterium]|nr:molybdopterin-dependent oxidoreductase [Methylococcales bacterium]
MKFQKIPAIKSSEITEQSIFENRRQLIKLAMVSTVGLLVPTPSMAKIYSKIPSGKQSVNLETTDFKDVSNYTNYYEFTTNKQDATHLAKNLKTDPWSVTVEGEVEKKGTFFLEDILKNNALEERIYRFRCVEAWSMVVPWIGFSLADFIKQFKPTSKAKFVEFTTLYDPEI